MNHYEKIAEIKKFTDSVGSIYGTEDFAIYLYSLIKMTKSKTVLELGTGFGTTALWAALALEENKQGIIHTVDNGSEWPKLAGARDLFGNFYDENYQTYIKNLFKHFDLTSSVQFYNQSIDNIVLDNIDILFCDYSHDPFTVLKLLANYLAKMNEVSFIFIDSASTYYSSYQALESCISQLNAGRIPKTFKELINPKDLETIHSKIHNSKFELTHLIENKNRNQNSTTQIKIVPNDIMPHPRINIRF